VSNQSVGKLASHTFGHTVVNQMASESVSE